MRLSGGASTHLLHLELSESLQGFFGEVRPSCHFLHLAVAEGVTRRHLTFMSQIVLAGVCRFT